MKQLILLSSLLFCLLFIPKTQAQKITFGPINKLDKKEIIQGIFATDEQSFYVLKQGYRLGKTGKIIECYGLDFKLKYSTFLDFFSERNNYFEQAFEFQGKLYVGFSVREKKKGKITYYYRNISKETGKSSWGKSKNQNIPDGSSNIYRNAKYIYV